jgi:hypothetical protein
MSHPAVHKSHLEAEGSVHIERLKQWHFIKMTLATAYKTGLKGLKQDPESKSKMEDISTD